MSVGFPTARQRLRAPSTVEHARAADRRWISRRAYLFPMLLIVLLTSAFVGSELAQAPVTSGVDPGHWLSISYSYVGLPTAPDPTDRMLFYPPLMFPLLGGLVVLTGDPVAAADALAVLLFAAYGLSVAYLARRFLVSGPLQVALVGLAVFSGTTIQMVFWGGYPNLLGFALMNLAIVFLLRFVRTQKSIDAVGLYGLAALTYLGHDLSFAELVGILATAGIFLLLLGRIRLRFALHPANVFGVLGLAGLVVGYSTLTAHLGVPHASYFTANPAAYYIDQVGELFTPLWHAPAFLPAGARIVLESHSTAILLALAPVVALVLLLLIRRDAPRAIDTRLTIAAGWLAASLAIPGAGYLLHVDTDYTRFLYFIPLPFALVVLLAVERAALDDLVPQLNSIPPRPAGPPSPGWVAGPPSIRPDRPAKGPTVAAVVVTIFLTMVLLGVTIPTVQAQQASGTATAHDDQFLQAMHWLKDAPSSGNVLTVPSAARWVEALTQRDGLTVGPVWLLFNPFQITDSQEAYWAFCSQFVVTNNRAALAYSGFATSTYSQAPTYAAYVEGVPFPVFRVLPGSLTVNATVGGSTADMPLVAGTNQPVQSFDASGQPRFTVVYQNAAATVTEVGSARPDGSTVLSFEVTPQAGADVHSVSYVMTPPPKDSPTLATNNPVDIVQSGNLLDWSVVGKLGQYPNPITVQSHIVFSPAPVSVRNAVLIGPDSWSFSFANPSVTSPFVVSMNVTTPQAKNPTNPLPPTLSTQGFLAEHGIHYLLWYTKTGYLSELTYYEATFGYRVAFQNSEWAVLEG